MDAQARRTRRAAALVLSGPLAVAVVSALGAAWSVAGGPANAPPPAPAAPAPRDAYAYASTGTLAPGTIVVRVRLAAALRRVVAEDDGNGDLAVTLPAGSTVGTLLNQLAGRYPVVAALGPSVMVAVSGEMLRPGDILAAGDAVDLVTQMAGG